VRKQSERDLLRAELIAFPLLLLLALWIFRGLVAALLPVAAGLLSIFTTLALLRLVNDVQPISVFALNLVTGAGLGLAIDYQPVACLALPRGACPSWAGRRMRCARRSRPPGGRSPSVPSPSPPRSHRSSSFRCRSCARWRSAGSSSPRSPAPSRCCLLPALFSLLGERVNSLAPARWQRAAERAARPDEHGGWYRYAHAVMRRPVPVALASTALLVTLGLPVLGVRFIGVDASVLPSSASARRADDALHRFFARGIDSPLHLAVRVADAGPVVAELQQLPDVAAVARPERLGAQLWSVDVIPRTAAMSSETKNLVREVRQLPSVSVGGRTAWYLDTAASLKRGLPLALAVLVGAISMLLFVVTRSIVLPLKALVMNALGLAAAFGILVFIFQDGRLEGLLGYRSQGALELTQPVLLAAIAFGLATDYGVFLLSRIKEAHDAGLPNREAVALGLERTGRVVTSAALLFCVAVGAFATSSSPDRQGTRPRDRAGRRDRRLARPRAARAESDGAARRLELVGAVPAPPLSPLGFRR